MPDDVTAGELDVEVRRDLRGLQKDTADSVARHLVAAGRLVDEEPALALEHARFARRRASRIAVVREAAGIAAYHAGEWAEALAELRAARRMGGGPVHVPVMADIERALGRPERAIDLARGPEVRELDPSGRIELAIVAAGARRDLGEVDAAVVTLQIPELDAARRDPWSARLFYAYADNLLAAGRGSDAVEWFVHSVDADEAGETDAARRIAEITGDDDPDDPEDITFGEEEVPVAVEVVTAPVVRPPVVEEPAVEEPAGPSRPDDEQADADGRSGQPVVADSPEQAAVMTEEPAVGDDGGADLAGTSAVDPPLAGPGHTPDIAPEDSTVSDATVSDEDGRTFAELRPDDDR